MPTTIYSPAHKRLINQLKQARKEAHLNQTMVAQKLGATQSQISILEQGQRKIDVILLKELAKIYKKRISYFLEEG